MAAAIERAPGGALRARLPDGTRWHFQHGPIDLVLRAWGPGDAPDRAAEAAWAAFPEVLTKLVSELKTLREPVQTGTRFAGPVARRMARACAPFSDRFVTPMAAVAGAVADHVLAAMVAAAPLERAFVNDGGDIALHLTPGHSLALGVVGDVRAPALDGLARIGFDDPVRGVATSGRDGRSLSLGIADAVTVLAGSAAAADVAATLIANAVDVDDPAVSRAPARSLDPDSDLGERPVTVAVGPLSADSVRAALDRGAAEARRLRARGLIEAALLVLRGENRVVGAPVALPGGVAAA